ncbi:MAG TPA: SRPBCC domain-containing protein [Flavitalea sp.]|nr:SRPBCC domain-containing protein [Flavitalea sp.]
MQKENSSFRQEGNQLIYTRLLNAPRELVWEVWTDPVHIKEWWGPTGFTLTHKSMDVKAGKLWKFTMHGYGQDFENKIEYIEVVKPSLLTYRHRDEADTIDFTVYVTFEEIGAKTFLTMRSVFASKEVIEELDRKVNAIEGGKQNLNRLENYINNLGEKSLQ